ncbi:DUF4397 domain-containing protein [Ideonella azotifigens]|uniref:DUF4397 domain-containing protein n=1 Tax=Ideonella azotifigens TaxID=513160 RepID=A0ABN1JPL2_9BURK|nr:DUF4397 domain-containing protein [Ideonella azotifigens]MCD2340083.1 DUF4397 domain-containing protein [Ideonella azotifigens]
MKKRTLLGLLAVLPLSLLTACGSSDSGGSTSARLINASPGYSSLDLYVEDSLKVSGVGFGTASSFHDVDSGDVTTALTVSGSATELLTQTRTFSGSDKYSIVAYGWDGALKSAAITEDEDEADSGKTKYSVLNTSTDAGTLDVYLTAEDDELASATAVRAGVDGGTRSAFSTVTSGTYRLRVTASGDTDDVRLDVSNVVLPSKGVMTLILTPTSGGLLVNGMTLQQGGDVTQQFTTKARMRVVAAVAGGAKVTAGVGDTTLVAGLPSPGIQNPYVLVDAGSVTVNASAGSTTLSPLTLTVGAGSDTTLLVTGASAAAATVTALADDNRLPTTTTKYKIRMVHVSNTLAAGSLNLTVTLSPVVSNLTYGTGSSYVSRTSSTAADVVVSSNSDGSTVYEKSGSDALSLTAKSVYTMFILDKIDGTPQGLFLQER